ncbi:putative transcriptional regulatory protein [Mycobacterium kansasii]|uniref:Putative transcriptional regulatory protein n=1 Tax=Mycobacterium kansasii TaxID=1768 RepID=A0A1V3X0D0_MYCKA|nr:putative transcriptional regulatory protein [Mycobacterium kansasii]
MRDEANYAGPTINRTARLRDLAHGGQTVLSGATEPLVVDHLPTGCGWPIWATTHCGICHARNASSSCAIPTCATTSAASHPQCWCVT